ncbi:tRNA uridine(34) 5-carboxymethylaminomethyl modification radical SAM/GNAT enzyme Elp3 [Patescibacteria group bacterium]|nr:tRNA uridine(34) 5-carboxymethylaminomethyl modification radical SAM/GNAT enzyme Elp3 [Patescibacteria group bacterium]
MVKIWESTPKESLRDPTGQAIKELIKNRVKTQVGLAKIKRKIAKKYKIPLPSNIELLKAYHNLIKKKSIKKSENLENLLKKRKIRSLSGVVVVSVLTKPYPCPGKCIYCPSEKGLPKSYLSGEPAVERAKKLKFDPYLQSQKRIESLKRQGHPTDKIELRIIGATFSVYPKKYKIWFISNCFAAANKRKGVSKKEVSWKILEKQQKINEKAKQRIIGISIETRPDLINKNEILNLRKLGVTMVEIGVQTIFDDILEKCKRGHGVKETVLTTKILKDAGFKVMYQMMPNLPGSDLKRDLKCFEEIFKNKSFKPDWLKIYPCVVCKESKLYQIWKKRKYKTYSDEKLIELLIKIKKTLPYWVRVARLFRDIPIPKIKGGCKISNLREVVQQKMKEKGESCCCIRCREVRGDYNPKEKFYLFRENYEASEGKEIFLSYENKNREKLLSFLRLRVPSCTLRASGGKPFQKYFLPVLENSAIIREVHTYGRLVPISKRKIAPQHRGLGKKLIKMAEKITKKEFGLNKITVISGVGVRNYWRRLGYKLKNNYMIKEI